MWTKKQRVVSLSTAESERYAADKTAPEGLGIQSVANYLGKACGLSKVPVPLAAEWRAGIVFRRRWERRRSRSTIGVSWRVIMRGGHSLTVWTKKQRVVSLSTAESERYAADKTAPEGLGIQSVANYLAKHVGRTCIWMPQRRCAWPIAEDWTRRSTPTCKTVDTGGMQGKKIRHEASRHEREPRRLDDEAAAGDRKFSSLCIFWALNLWESTRSERSCTFQDWWEV